MSSLTNTLLFVQQQLIRYVYPIYLIFGVIGCCLNIILLSRRQFRTVSCCTYFIVASVAMLFTLLVGITSAIYSIDHDNPYTTIVAFCKIRSYLLQTSSMIYRWCLAVACFDRYALTSTKVRLRNFAKIRVSYRVITVIVLIWLVLPVYILVVYDLRDGKCGPLYNIDMAYYHSIFAITTGGVLPVSIMIICAVFIRHNLVLKRAHRRQLAINQQNNRVHAELRRDQQVFAMLLVQALVYLVTQTPFILFSFYTAATISLSKRSTDRVAIERFINFITEVIVYLLPVSSFCLYTLISHTFRDELKKLLPYPLRCRGINIVNRINPLRNDGPVHTLAYS